MEQIKYIVVHCSDSLDYLDFGAADIHRWHLERGWSGIGYHKVITRSGAVQDGRPLYWAGAHEPKVNSCSWAVCLIGKKQFTDQQFEALENLLKEWKKLAPGAEILGHCKLNSEKTCPNFDVPEFIKDIEWK